MGDDRRGLSVYAQAACPSSRDLQLIGNNLTNVGLAAILDNCPRLESLGVRRCCNLQMGDAMRSKDAARIRNLRLPQDSISDFKYRAYAMVVIDYPGSDPEVRRV
ncbi:hypothetical protein ZWY2020_010515 [Hordeum vulgare]|nr:hypothetical protein ZWY2020_010515 [Hordeum vulgare]